MAFQEGLFAKNLSNKRIGRNNLISIISPWNDRSLIIISEIKEYLIGFPQS